MTSRLTSDAFIPSVPMVMPSEIEMVLNSMGVPPAARMPAFTCAASSRRWIVARADLDPGVGDADDGLPQVVVGKADGLEHRTRRRAACAFGNRRAGTRFIRRHKYKQPSFKDGWYRLLCL